MSEKTLGLLDKAVDFLAERNLVGPRLENACIEISGCNCYYRLKCDAESQQQGANSETRYISVPFFRGLIDQLAKTHTNVSLNFGSESLHPHFKELLEYACSARKRGLGRISWFDNGMLFSKDISELVLKLQVDEIIFSLGSDYDETAAANIEVLVNIRGDSRKTKVSINKTGYENYEKNMMFLKHWLGIADQVYIHALHQPKYVVHDAKQYFADFSYSNLPDCPFSHGFLGVLPDGRVVACGGNDCAAHCMGHASVTPLKRIWQTDRFRLFREATKEQADASFAIVRGMAN